MGLLTGALLGGTEGFGTGLAKAGELEWKDDHERMREQAAAAREERNIQLKAEAERALETQKGHVVPAGASLKREGQPDFQAPEKPISEEEKAVMRAHANYYNSAARAAAAKEPKATLPKIVPLKDEQGNVIAVLDENTGAVGTPTPGSQAKEAVSHWFSANEAAKPAVPAGLTWVGPDRQPIAGIHVYYPDMVKRGVGTPGASPAAPSQPSARPSLASFFSTPAAPAPARVGAQPQAQPGAQAPSMPQAPASGNAVDAARTKLSAAQQTLQSYGLMQQRRDPQGFIAAQQAVAAAKQDLDTSMSQYQNELGPVGAARPLLRMK